MREYRITSAAENIEQLCLDEKESIGYTLKALSAGLWVYFNSTSFEEGLLKIVNDAGDADTNALVAGSILGLNMDFKAFRPNTQKDCAAGTNLMKK